MTSLMGGSVVIVTGAAGGIGAAIASTLAADGASVVVADVNGPGADAEAARLRRLGYDVTPAVVDITNRESVKTMVTSVFGQFGRIDCLVNNAAIDAPPGLAWEIDADEWTNVIEVNLSGQWWCTQAVLPAMMDQQRGKVIFISSVSARMGDLDTSVAYNAAKAGVIGLTIGLSVHLERHGILVNAIAPGPTGTGRPMTERQRTSTLEAMPLGIRGPQPVADACLFLARSSGDWVTGAVLNISGGMWRG